MRLSFAGESHVGLKRDHNEDAWLALPGERLFCVADGMGGHSSGELAARLAVEEMAECFRLAGRGDETPSPVAVEPGRGGAEERLRRAVQRANLRVRERARADDRLRGMGTTLVCAHLLDGERAALVGNVGDSRAYLWRAGALRQLTEDHSLLNDYIKANRPTAEEIRSFPHKNVILRALGMRDELEVDVSRHPLEDGDAVLLCCDGLSGMVADADIAGILRSSGSDPQQAVHDLVAAANAAGGLDNVTAVLVRVHEA